MRSAKTKPSNLNKTSCLLPQVTLAYNPNQFHYLRKISMAYADHAFSIFDEYIMMDSDSVYTTHNRTPVKKIALTVSLLRVISIISGIIMVVNCVNDNTRSVTITIISSFLNLPFIVSLFVLKMHFLFD
ncbi:hypothetical protein Hdeb2414_s0018g00530301 [Helianthus debilis subsp. tardiflorus]